MIFSSFNIFDYSEVKARKEYMPCFAVAAASGGEQNGLNLECMIPEL